MTQMEPYPRGRRDGIRWAITWLHQRAIEMNDWRAKAVLNSAAFGMGVDLKYERGIDRYNPEFVEEILRIAKLPPEATFDNLADMLKWLDAPRSSQDIETAHD